MSGIPSMINILLEKYSQYGVANESLGLKITGFPSYVLLSMVWILVLPLCVSMTRVCKDNSSERED
jgi:hypothetical protein